MARTLCEDAEAKIAEINEKAMAGFADPAIIKAMKLADLFEAIKPEESVLPLDALAGFPVAARTETY